MAAPTARKACDLEAEIAFLTRALKAPTLRESVERLAERAREETWSHEEFLVACLQREVAARDAHGGEGRIRAARLPARKSLEEFDCWTGPIVRSPPGAQDAPRWDGSGEGRCRDRSLRQGSRRRA
jgi:DNA replication protein DnaC